MPLCPPLGSPISSTHTFFTGMVPRASRVLSTRRCSHFGDGAIFPGRYVCTHGTPGSPRTRSLTQKVGTCLVVAFRFNQPRSHANLLRGPFHLSIRLRLRFVIDEEQLHACVFDRTVREYNLGSLRFEKNSHFSLKKEKRKSFKYLTLEYFR